MKRTDPLRYNAVLAELRGEELPTETIIEVIPATEKVTEEPTATFTLSEEMAVDDVNPDIVLSTENHEDGSVTYTMRESDHEELLAKVGEQLEASINQTIENGTYSMVNNIRRNDDFTVFYVSTENIGDYNEYNAYLLSLELLVYAGIYQRINGVDDIHFEVKFLDNLDVEYYSVVYPSDPPAETEPQASSAPLETVRYTGEVSKSYVSSYVLNTHTMKAHVSSCGEVSKINASNKSTYTGTASDLKGMGYSPCQKCNPW